jgi:hypothetical protein
MDGWKAAIGGAGTCKQAERKSHRREKCEVRGQDHGRHRGFNDVEAAAVTSC